MSAPRCKPGDLAVVVNAYTPGMIGRFVIVVRLAEPHEFNATHPGESVTWIVRSASESPLPVPSPRGIRYKMERPFADIGLRPIRPDEGKDESLSWASPVTVGVA